MCLIFIVLQWGLQKADIGKLNTEKDFLSSKLCEQNGIIYNLKDNNANLNDKIVLKNRKIRDLEREVGQKMSDLDELRTIFNF